MRSDTSLTASRATAPPPSPAPPPFWSPLIALPEDETLVALDTLVAEGLLRRVPLSDQTFYIAAPPHAPGRGDG